MRIESFHIQGFKSLADVQVEGLSDINVFYGLNNVGKSNIFEALALWNYELTNPQKPMTHLTTPPIFPLEGSRSSHFKVRARFTWSEIFSGEKEIQVWQTNLYRYGHTKTSRRFSLSDQIHITSQFELLPHEREARVEQPQHFVEELQATLPPNQLPPMPSAFHTIKAERRFQAEQKAQKNKIGPIAHHNLKQALFYAYLSRDMQQKQRFTAIKRTLAEDPFNLGELDVALDPESDRIDIGFVGPTGRLPLENMGSGVRQLLLVLGQVFLNDYPIIAIEEPEMNLSPEYQQYLLQALRRLMQDPAVKLNQLFISTHSPYFEFAETFFDVTMDKGVTHINRLPLAERSRYFPPTEVGSQTGARLNSFNQVKLYEGLIEDLGLQRGNLVLFTKNPQTGHWEIRPEEEINPDLESIIDDQAS